MAQKSYSKHSEYRTYSTKGNFDDKEFESMKAELLPSKYGSLIQPGNVNNNESYYEYSEEKNPAGTYDRKDLHTVEQYDYTNSPGDRRYNQSAILASSVTPQRVMNTTTTTTTTNRDLSHNIEELDSLLDDLQKDQERRLYKGGYTSDTLESSSFDYRTGNALKSSGYSTLNKMDRDAEWLPTPPPPTVSREVIRNQITESHVTVPTPQPVPAIVCSNCQGHSNVQVSGTPMNKVTTTVKTYTYEVPADQDPTTIPIPGLNNSASSNTNTIVSEKYHTTDRNIIQENQEHRTYVNTHFNTSTPVKQPAPLPQTNTLPPPSPQPVTNTLPPPSPQPGCQYCTHCNSRITTTSSTSIAGSPLPPHHHHPSPHGTDGTKVTTRTTHYTTTNTGYPGNRGSPYPPNHSPTYAVPIDNTPKSDYPPNQGGPPGTTVYKYTTTNYSTYNNSTTDGRGKPGPFPSGNLSPPTSPSPFPRSESPAPRNQEVPKRIDELLSDFPVDNYPSDDGIRRRPNPPSGPAGPGRNMNGNFGAIGSRESEKLQQSNKKNEVAVVTPSKNVEGSAVYYPPGHEMFARKDDAAYQQAGGGYMKAKGQYKYEAESSSKSKSSTQVKAVPVCLPLCCAMPCVLL